MNKVDIKTKDAEGNDVVVHVVKPNNMVQQEAQIHAGHVVRKALENRAMLRAQLDTYMREAGLWDDEKQKEDDKLSKEIEKNILKLRSGGIKLSQARELAIKVRQLRLEQTTLRIERRKLDEYTVEGQGENSKFNYLVYACTLNEDGNKYFESIEDYQNNTSSLAFDAASALANMIYGLDANWEANLPENQFLSKFKFVNDKLQLVNKEGKRITVDNKLIDDEGRYINDKGEYVDINGRLIDKDGLPIVESKPFLDEDGKPIA